MKITRVGEFGLISLIRKACRTAGKQIVLPIGDDAAVIKLSPGELAVLTTDTLVEGVHFHLNYCSFYELGWKALAANLSDLAAMGAKPLGAVVTLGLDNRFSTNDVMELYRGLSALAKKYDSPIVGGDIVRSPSKLFVSIAALGEISKERIIERGGARIGDLICVTGALGEAQAGLELLLRKSKNTKHSFPSKLARKHLQPSPRLKESQFLTTHVKLHAMIDVSDGLAADLGHICEESGVGAQLWGEKMPISRRAILAAGLLREDPLSFALFGGEEYELLITLSPGEYRKLKTRAKFKITAIGEIVSAREGMSIIRNNRRFPLASKGYTHF